MRIELDVPEIPATVMDGYETTREIRRVHLDELYLILGDSGLWTMCKYASPVASEHAYIIVRKVKPKIWMPEDGKEYHCLKVQSYFWGDVDRYTINRTHRDSGNIFPPGSINLKIAIDAIAKDIEDE